MFHFESTEERGCRDCVQERRKEGTDCSVSETMMPRLPKESRAARKSCGFLVDEQVTS